MGNSLDSIVNTIKAMDIFTLTSYDFSISTLESETWMSHLYDPQFTTRKNNVRIQYKKPKLFMSNWGVLTNRACTLAEVVSTVIYSAQVPFLCMDQAFQLLLCNLFHCIWKRKTLDIVSREFSKCFTQSYWRMMYSITAIALYSGTLFMIVIPK